MDIELECTYCGYKWRKIVYSKHSIENERCSICKDAYLKIKDLIKTNIDYYGDSLQSHHKERDFDS